jgi:hypothetical protein
MDMVDVLLVGGGIALAVFVGSKVLADDPTPTHPETNTVGQGIGSQDASDDVDLLTRSATIDRIGTIRVPLLVTNHSSKPSNYLIDVTAIRGNTRIGQSLPVTVNHLAPGSRASETVLFYGANGATSFQVVSVSRTASY